MTLYLYTPFCQQGNQTPAWSGGQARSRAHTQECLRCGGGSSGTVWECLPWMLPAVLACGVGILTTTSQPSPGRSSLIWLDPPTSPPPSVDCCLQGVGLGRALAERMVCWLREDGFGTVTVQSVSRAVSFYDHIGFEQVPPGNAAAQLIRV